GAPFAATLLADLGAEVIKVELPGQGDFMRTIGPFADGYSLFWAVEGRNKKSITCDLRKPAGQALMKRLVPQVDVVVENFQPGTLERWGLGYDVLSALNPGLILTRVSVYGQTGPYRDRPGLDRNGIALGGLLYITGYPDRPPVRPGVIVSDYLTGVFNAFAIVSALYERDRRARQSGTPPRAPWSVRTCSTIRASRAWRSGPSTVTRSTPSWPRGARRGRRARSRTSSSATRCRSASPARWPTSSPTRTSRRAGTSWRWTTR